MACKFTLLRKIALFITGLGFLFAWLIFVGLGILEYIHDEKGEVFFFFAIVISFGQMLTFAMYRSDRRQRIIGWTIVVFFSTYLAYLVGSASVGRGNPSALFALYYASLASAVFHTIYGFFVDRGPKTLQARSGAPLGRV